MWQCSNKASLLCTALTSQGDIFTFQNWENLTQNIFERRLPAPGPQPNPAQASPLHGTEGGTGVLGLPPFSSPLHTTDFSLGDPVSPGYWAANLGYGGQRTLLLSQEELML